MIYFIQDKLSGAIKIGVAREPRARMRLFQIGCPSKLRLLGTIPGGYLKEASLHEDLHRFRIRGEWFRDDHVVLAIIADLLNRPVGNGKDRERFHLPEDLQWPDWVTPRKPVRWGIGDRVTGQVFLDGAFCGLEPNADGWEELGYRRSQMIQESKQLLLFDVHGLLQHAYGPDEDDDHQDGIIAQILHYALIIGRDELALPERPFEEPCDCAICSGRYALDSPARAGLELREHP